MDKKQKIFSHTPVSKFQKVLTLNICDGAKQIYPKKKILRKDTLRFSVVAVRRCTVKKVSWKNSPLFYWHATKIDIKSGQNLSKPVKILISLTRSRNLLSRNHSTLTFAGRCQYLITNFMIVSYNKCRSSRSQMFFKIGVLKNFAIFARKHLWWILFLINLFNKNTYFEKHLRTAAFEI